MSKFDAMVEELTGIIESSYENGTTMDQAEKLAGRFLHAQLVVSAELATKALDARMRKSGLKAVRSAVYLSEATKTDKKPTEAALSALIDTIEVVQGEQEALDKADTTKEELERLYDVFGNAHIFYRTVAKGSFGG